MKTAIIGVGAMGGAIAEGILHSCKVNPADIIAANPHTDRLGHLVDAGVMVTSDNKAAAAKADVVIVAVKPWLAEDVMKDLKTVMDYRRQVLVSVVAGVTAAQINGWMQKDGALPQLFLVIPNTAATICESMTFIAPCNASEHNTELIKKLFDNIGSTIITDERHLAAGMVLASCGTAFALRYIRASAEGGVELGFRAAEATRIVAQTVKGAACLLMDSGSHPEEEIDKVTTAGGLTIKGLNAMEQAGFTGAVIQGLKAAGK